MSAGIGISSAAPVRCAGYTNVSRGPPYFYLFPGGWQPRRNDHRAFSNNINTQYRNYLCRPCPFLQNQQFGCNRHMKRLEETDTTRPGLPFASRRREDPKQRPQWLKNMSPGPVHVMERRPNSAKGGRKVYQEKRQCSKYLKDDPPKEVRFSKDDDPTLHVSARWPVFSDHYDRPLHYHHHHHDPYDHHHHHHHHPHHSHHYDHHGHHYDFVHSDVHHHHHGHHHGHYHHPHGFYHDHHHDHDYSHHHHHHPYYVVEGSPYYVDSYHHLHPRISASETYIYATRPRHLHVCSSYSSEFLPCPSHHQLFHGKIMNCCLDNKVRGIDSNTTCSSETEFFCRECNTFCRPSQPFTNFKKSKYEKSPKCNCPPYPVNYGGQQNGCGCGQQNNGCMCGQQNNNGCMCGQNAGVQTNTCPKGFPTSPCDPTPCDPGSEQCQQGFNQQGFNQQGGCPPCKQPNTQQQGCCAPKKQCGELRPFGHRCLPFFSRRPIIKNKYHPFMTTTRTKTESLFPCMG